MSDEPGFEINGEFYPVPSSYRLADPVLVREITGLGWNDFAELLDQGDFAAFAGVLAVAVWQKHPEWRRDKVVRFVENLDSASVTSVGDSDDGERVVLPPDGDDTPSRPESLTGSGDVSAVSATTPDPIGLLSSGISSG